MFVSSPPECRLAFPAKSRPLLPIFTFVESQSCMNLRTDLGVLEYQDWGLTPDVWRQTNRVGNAASLARPQETDQSPMRRIEDALRTQQQTHSVTGSNAPASTPRSKSRASSKTTSPARIVPNYSYKLVPDNRASTTEINTEKDAALGSGQDALDTDTIIDRASRAHQQPPHNRGYFVGTSLLSFFSNPRTTRAPFKPQKSNRGTSSWQLKQYAEATLGSGSLRKAVKLPEGEDKDEWLAVNGET
jgi:MOB kinase activator 1